MILSNADKRTFDRYVMNILEVWEGASEDDRQMARNWYPVANQLAEVIGDGDVRKGAGVIAALSPLKRWEENVRLATKAVSGSCNGHTGDALAKARAILEGADPATVLPMRLKTGNFYRNILDPLDPEPVTIDRHAHDVAVGERYGNRARGLGKTGRYDLLAQAYRETGRELFEIPNVPQAWAWTAQRRKSTSNREA
jgi:hypothetical protein